MIRRCGAGHAGGGAGACVGGGVCVGAGACMGRGVRGGEGAGGGHACVVVAGGCLSGTLKFEPLIHG